MSKKNNIPSLADLELEAGPKPFEFDLGESVITFPSPTDMKWEDAQRFMNMLSGGDVEFATLFAVWLSEEDYMALEKADLTLGQTVALVKMVSKHYESVFGTAGE